MSKDWNGIVDDILDQTARHRSCFQLDRKAPILLANLAAAASSADNLVTLTELAQNTFGEDISGTQWRTVARLLNIISAKSKTLSERMDQLQALVHEAGLGEPCR